MQPTLFHASEHAINFSEIDRDALAVVQRLRSAGYTAYLVGGCVRDFLTKRRPKDYDISTSARPEEIKKIFGRQCLIIGRRFRLAHIRFGQKIIEVSTFRTGDSADSDLITQDNEWGTPEEDVLRRDFTINGLFYDPEQHAVIDFVGGWKDIHTGTLRTIGAPEVRFKQDPVRMIRLLKFRARFGFEIDPTTRKALIRCREEIIKSSPARVLEEMLRMLESTAASPFYRLMREAALLELLFPELADTLGHEVGTSIYRLLSASDHLHKHEKPLDRASLACSLVYPLFEKEVLAQPNPHMGDILMIAGATVRRYIMEAFSHFPRRISSTMIHILAGQFRITPPPGKKATAQRSLHTKEFDLVLQFFKIRAVADSSLQDTYHHWQDQMSRLEQREPAAPRSRRRRR